MKRTKFESFCREYGLEFIRRLAEDGYTEEEIAQRAGLDPAEFKVWSRRHKKLRDAIELGRREADFSVVEAIYKRATGYNVLTKKTHKLKRVDFDPVTGKKIREYEELAVADDEDYVPPDLRASIFWLKNRQPERWSEKGIGIELGEGGIVELPQADLIDPVSELCDPVSGLCEEDSYGRGGG